MRAILKKIEVIENHRLSHPIKMFFADSEESNELFLFLTTIETQFCRKDEYDLKEGLPDDLAEEKII
ncbi:hypothetical protein, partial [uncultured Treponema sp.]|uniref:hypothetical protein n=1 Tax=uncultured Treponema sp. TaxID=162155 RepID=UPI0025919A89